MPTYEYECLHCRHKFEVLQSIVAKPISKCPKCGKKVKKLVSSGAGFIFNGAGFYATDYKKAKRPAEPGHTCAHTCPKAKAGCPEAKH